MFYYCHILLIASLQARTIEMFVTEKNPSKSEVIGRCGGDEKTEWPRRTDTSRTVIFKKTFGVNII